MSSGLRALDGRAAGSHSAGGIDCDSGVTLMFWHNPASLVLFQCSLDEIDCGILVRVLVSSSRIRRLEISDNGTVASLDVGLD